MFVQESSSNMLDGVSEQNTVDLQNGAVAIEGEPHLSENTELD